MMTRHDTIVYGVVAVLSILMAATPLHADFDAGMTAYSSGDYQTAFEEWSPLAEQGSAAAQFNMGLLYRYGKGRDADAAQAAGWYLRAAESGFAPAQYEIAEMYEAGEGIEQDVIQAYKWFKLAAEERYEDARKRRKRLGNRMTSSEIALAEMWMREWKKARKESGSGEDQP
jgi:TPR repeat protein